MSLAAAALRSGAAALLEAEGKGGLAALVESAGVELAGKAEIWSIGSREVTAHRLALSLAAPEYARMAASHADRESVKGAFTAAMRTPETELAEMVIVLELPGIQRGWHRAYREEIPREEPERPSPDEVLAGAVLLLAAAGKGEAGAAALRAELEISEVTGSDEPLVRCVVRLDAADRQAAERRPGLAEDIRAAVRDAATRAATRVASVDLASRLRSSGEARGEGPRDDAESRLTRALVAKGFEVVPVSREPERTTLVVVGGGRSVLVDLVPSAKSPVARGAATLPRYVVDASALASDEDASVVSGTVGAAG